MRSAAQRTCEQLAVEFNGNVRSEWKLMLAGVRDINDQSCSAAEITSNVGASCTTVFEPFGQAGELQFGNPDRVCREGVVGTLATPKGIALLTLILKNEL